VAEIFGYAEKKPRPSSLSMFNFTVFQNDMGEFYNGVRTLTKTYY
jgi:hypothetical protein